MALRHDSPYVAAATYALSDVIFTTRKESKALPPPLYCHLHGGQASLTSDDLGWAALEQPDRTGFRGLTCSALVLGTCFPNQFTETGYRLGSAQGGAFKWSSPYDSDVVCFESAAEDTHGVHAADIVSEDQGAFPPNTLFRLKSIDEKGSWKAPNGVWPQQRRLIVTATFRAPSDAHISATGSRWTTAYDAEEAALSEDELFRRRQTDRLWKVKLCGPGGVINGFRGPVRGPEEAKAEARPSGGRGAGRGGASRALVPGIQRVGAARRAAAAGSSTAGMAAVIMAARQE